MASFISLIPPKISLPRLLSMLASSGHSLPLPKAAPLRLISRSFCTISHKASFEDSSPLDRRYSYSDDIPTLMEEIDTLRSRMCQVLFKGRSDTVGFQTVVDSYPEELLKEIDDVLSRNLFVKQGCRSAYNWSQTEGNVYLRIEVPGVDRAGLKCRVYKVFNRDFVMYKKEVNFTGVADIDPEFGDLEVGREYIFQADFPPNFDANNSRYYVKKGVFWMVVPKFAR